MQVKDRFSVRLAAAQAETAKLQTEAKQLRSRLKCFEGRLARATVVNSTGNTSKQEEVEGRSRPPPPLKSNSEALARPPDASAPNPPKAAPARAGRVLGWADTGYNADAVEFCPYAVDHLVCGTYQLEEGGESGKAQDQTRHGRLHIYRTDPAAAAAAATPRDIVGSDADGTTVGNRVHSNRILVHLSSLDVPGIFDIKWSGSPSYYSCDQRIAEGGLPATGPSTSVTACAAPAVAPAALLGHAAADGFVYTYTLQDDYTLLLSGQIDCRASPEDVGALSLSLDWNDRKPGITSIADRAAAVSLSDGSVCVIKVAEDGELRKTRQWTAHDLEAWIVGFDCHTPTTMFTGADDAKLKGWDLRAGPAAPTFVNSKVHEAGVCSIQSHPTVEHCLATGSYDEQLRIWDTRTMKRPLSTAHVGGGIWRVKWSPDPACAGQVLTACMHAGFAVLEYNHDAGKFEGEILRHTGGHTSLGYGVDWQWRKAAAEGRGGNFGMNLPVVGSASFYDHRLEVWCPQMI